jgi:hypothetical protein
MMASTTIARGKVQSMTQQQPQWGYQPPQPGYPVPQTQPQQRPAVAGERRPGRFRRNLTTIMAASALVISVAGLVLPVDQNAAPAAAVAGPQGPQGERGERGPKGPKGDPGAPAQAPPAPEAPPAPAPAAPEAPSGQEFSDGEYKVGVDIQPGEYAGKVTDQGEFSNGYWARLDKSRGIIDNGLVTKAGATMRLTVRSTDAYVEISGATFHKV